MKIKFGTEGWRAIIAEEFTAENVRIVTQAIAEHYLEAAKGQPLTLAVGYDSRFLSDYFARACAEVLAGNGIRVVLSTGIVPTCGVSRYVVEGKLPAGIMITASHNPGSYNGIKIKEAYGGSATTETVLSVERRMGESPVKRTSLEEAKQASRVSEDDFMPAFLDGIKAFVDLKAIRRSPYKVVVDSMYGAGGTIIERLLSGGRCKVTTLHGQRDPLFGGHAPEPIELNLGELKQTVKRTKAHLGIANDGDADRLGIYGPGGVWLTPGQVMCLFVWHLVTARKATGAVVKTVSNTMMINRLAERLGLKLLEVPVGFKHIAKLMLEQDVLIGGEESGGIAAKGYLPERDGIATGLLVLEAMAIHKKPLNALIGQLEKDCGRWYYGRRDLHLKQEQVDALFTRLERQTPDRMGAVPVASVNRLDGIKLIGKDDSWLLFRRSGTEPIVRIYAETPQKAGLPALLSYGVSLAQGA